MGRSRHHPGLYGRTRASCKEIRTAAEVDRSRVCNDTLWLGLAPYSFQVAPLVAFLSHVCWRSDTTRPPQYMVSFSVWASYGIDAEVNVLKCAYHWGARVACSNPASSVPLAVSEPGVFWSTLELTQLFSVLTTHPLGRVDTYISLHSVRLHGL